MEWWCPSLPYYVDVVDAECNWGNNVLWFMWLYIWTLPIIAIQKYKWFKICTKVWIVNLLVFWLQTGYSNTTPWSKTDGKGSLEDVDKGQQTSGVPFSVPQRFCLKLAATWGFRPCSISRSSKGGHLRMLMQVSDDPHRNDSR